MFASANILSQNVTLKQGIRTKQANAKPQVRTSAALSGLMSKKFTFASSSFASSSHSKTLKVSSTQNLKMSKKSSIIVTNGVSSQQPGENLLDYSIHNKSKVPKPKPAPLNQEELLIKGAHHWVKNSLVAK